MAQTSIRETHPNFEVIFNPEQTDFPWKTEVPDAQKATLLAELARALPSRQSLRNKRYWKTEIMTPQELEEQQMICERCELPKHVATPGIFCVSKRHGESVVEPTHSFAFKPQPHLAHLGCSPPPDPEKPKYKAVAVDTESVVCGEDGKQVVKLSAVDLETGKILLDLFVQATAYVTDWLDFVHGITQKVLNDAHEKGNVVLGMTAAREALCTLISSDTMLVGHSVDMELNALGLVHEKCYCTQIWARSHCRSALGLAKLAARLVRGAVVQKNVHSCVEDAAITREVALAQILGSNYPRHVPKPARVAVPEFDPNTFEW